MYHREFKVIPKLAFTVFNRLLLRSYPNYQPVYLDNILKIGSDRGCVDRWELIKKEILSHNATSLMDIGCAEGFYTIQATKECGCFSIGVDADIRRLSIAQNQLIGGKIKPAGFLLGVVDEALLEKTPAFDVIIFMSVMHHMMYTYGVEYSRMILQKIRLKTKKCMIFEMGQSDETLNAWARNLPDMGTNPHEWIKDFLLSCGFSKALKIGETDSYKKDRKRALFVVEP